MLESCAGIRVMVQRRAALGTVILLGWERQVCDVSETKLGAIWIWWEKNDSSAFIKSMLWTEALLWDREHIGWTLDDWKKVPLSDKP
ncbi:hypothetical protein TNCV_1741921 [Trichonephila clavipes]|nr:hypothetical protein TNCV_1741921 [Trichonephila clavipes]